MYIPKWIDEGMWWLCKYHDSEENITSKILVSKDVSDNLIIEVHTESDKFFKPFEEMISNFFINPKELGLHNIISYADINDFKIYQSDVKVINDIKINCWVALSKEDQACPSCEGTGEGKSSGEPCETCGSSGKVRAHNILMIDQNIGFVLKTVFDIAGSKLEFEVIDTNIYDMITKGAKVKSKDHENGVDTKHQVSPVNIIIGKVGDDSTVIKDSVIHRSQIGKQEQSGNKIFKKCPYCGEELNLPKPPKLCPYCGEPLS